LKKIGGMDKLRINIAVIEPSDIIFEGLSNLIMKAGRHYYLFRLNNIQEFQEEVDTKNFNLIIINPAELQSKLPILQKIRKNSPSIFWVALVYLFFDNKLLNQFDESIYITDPADALAKKIQKLLSKASDDNNCSRQSQLSEREKKVLVQMVKGLSNKEVADRLNISVHTVVSHRKNIMEKTGIRSLPGLTIYAISKKIVPLESTPI
jgi:DNA-binding NarL/FixJ family response regulator